MPTQLPAWLTTLLSLLVALAAIAVLIADDADTTWALSSSTSALLGMLAGGAAGWNVPSVHDKPRGAP